MNLARDLVASEVGLDEVPDLVVGELAAGPQSDEGHQPPSPLRVLDPDHRCFLDPLVGDQELLDLAREYVLAAGDDHVVVASVDEQPPGVVEVPHIAGAHQPVDHVLAPPAGVALELEAVAHEDPTGTARSLDWGPVVIEELHEGAERRAAGRPGGGTEILGRGKGGPGDLGGAVEIVEDIAERAHRSASELGLELRPGQEDDTQRARVEASGR